MSVERVRVLVEVGGAVVVEVPVTVAFPVQPPVVVV